MSLALLHGSQPDVIVVCHDPTRERLLGDEDFPVPSVEEMIDLTIRLGSRTNAAIRVGGVSFNTGALNEKDAREQMARESARLGFAVCRPDARRTRIRKADRSCLG